MFYISIQPVLIKFSGNSYNKTFPISELPRHLRMVSLNFIPLPQIYSLVIFSPAEILHFNVGHHVKQYEIERRCKMGMDLG